MLVRVAMPEDAAVLVEFNAAMARETEQKELLLEVIGAGVRGLLANLRPIRAYADFACMWTGTTLRRRARTARWA
ncbi:MAG TPA: hypothetical protein VFR66_15845 [Burkholderiales bacterium]|nr:hypothetical protein [Burkholderiales bacterium]